MVRFKNRYFAVEIKAKDRPEHAPFDLKKMALSYSILKKIEEIHGNFGLGAVLNGFSAKYFNSYTKTALIRCRHGPHRFVGTVLPLINAINNTPVQVRILFMGATISKCYKFIANYQTRCVEKVWNKLKTNEERLQMKELFMKMNQ